MNKLSQFVLVNGETRCRVYFLRNVVKLSTISQSFRAYRYCLLERILYYRKDKTIICRSIDKSGTNVKLCSHNCIKFVESSKIMLLILRLWKTNWIHLNLNPTNNQKDYVYAITLLIRVFRLIVLCEFLMAITSHLYVLNIAKVVVCSYFQILLN